MTVTAKKNIFDFSLLKRVFVFVKPYKKQFYLSLFLAIFMAIASPIRPYLIQLTVNGAIGKTIVLPAWVKTVLFGIDLADITRFIIAVTLFQVVFLFIETTVRFLFSFITAWMGQHVVKDLRVTVYKKVLGLNLRQFDQTPIGTLTTRTINDIESINDIFFINHHYHTGHHVLHGLAINFD
ncbi:MAG: ATP-binding cassette subfamily B [Chitinophagaceae bacterium]|nr:MAG: ATP-binding cassette subfamily B [Chitinophagaceae bacterium]